MQGLENKSNATMRQQWTMSADGLSDSKLYKKDQILGIK